MKRSLKDNCGQVWQHNRKNKSKDIGERSKTQKVPRQGQTFENIDRKSTNKLVVRAHGQINNQMRKKQNNLGVEYSEAKNRTEIMNG